jgi:hypothetical protein
MNPIESIAANDCETPVIAEQGEGVVTGDTPPIATGADKPNPPASASAPKRQRHYGHGLCKCCSHGDSGSIDYSLANGAQLTQLSRRFGVSVDSLKRHRARHLDPSVVAKAKRKKLIGDSQEALEDLKRDESVNLLARLNLARARLNTAIERAEKLNDNRAIGQLVGRLHENLELVAKLLGDLSSGSTQITNNVLVTSPDYMRLRARLVGILRRHPAALRDVLLAFNETDAASAPKEIETSVS